jgi:hypothetical protein
MNERRSWQTNPPFNKPVSPPVKRFNMMCVRDVRDGERKRKRKDKREGK